MAVHMCSPLFTFLTAILLSSTSSADTPSLFVVSLDGFRHDYFNLVHLPNMEKLMASGAYVPQVKPVFPTKTYPIHQSLSTGLYTDTHGVVDNSFYDPVLGRELVALTDPEVYNGTNTQGIPIWTLNEAAGGGRHSGSMMWPGTDYVYDNTAISYTRTWVYSAELSEWRARVDESISWMTASVNPANLVLFYICDPDTSGHISGWDSELVKQQLLKLDECMGYLISELQSTLPSLNIILTSDHGMINIAPDTTIHMEELLDKQRFPHNIYSSSPMLNIEPQDGSEESFNLLHGELQRLSQENRFTVHTDFPADLHYNQNNNPRIGSLFVKADVGWSFQDVEHFKDFDGPLYGNHGWDNCADLNVFLIGLGPAFNKGSFQHVSMESVDLFPLMCALLELEMPPNHGNIQVTNTLLHSRHHEL